MSITVHTTSPTRIIAGDTFHWKDTPVNVADVSAYAVLFRSVEDSDIEFTVTGSDQTTYFLFELTGATTSALAGGEFTATALITYSYGRESEELDSCFIADNPTTTPTKSHCRKMVDFLKAHLEGRMPEGIEGHTIGGVPVSKIPIPEAELLLVKYEGKLRREVAKDKKLKNPSRASGNSVHINF
tara:strand:- start:8539 stop:9093 length:555 start_codon:yes stop_codon:yes gene_type:complete